MQDKNYESHASENNTEIKDRVIPQQGVNPENYSDVLKFSNCTGVTVDNCEIFGGQEDAIDAVRGELYTIKDTTLHPVYNGITLKGSIDTVTIQNVKFAAHGKDSDICIGQYDNYWYIGRKPTRNVQIIGSSATDGKPLVVKVWDADVPTVVNSNVKIVKIPKFIWWPYFVFRAIQTRGIKNLTTPVAAGTFIKTK